MMFLMLLVACGGKSEDSTGGDTSGATGAADCNDDYCTLSGEILEDMTIPAGKPYVLSGGVFVGDDVTETVLTIEPGATLYGETSSLGMLVVRRGSKLIAEGTADQPIVFTSAQAEGSRDRGDWGGIILNGRAPLNSCGDEAGTCEAVGEGSTGTYGGDDPNDSSGSLKYVRVEFSGALISTENELNGIAFQGVGAGTTVENLHVHMSADDGFEFFGGTVNARNLLVTAVGDDMFDWTDGWQGKGQFWVGQQWSTGGDNGFEGDNNGDSNDVTPRSSPTISHVTLIGSPDSEDSDDGLLIREGTAGNLSNIIVQGFGQSCVNVDNDATWAQIEAGALVLSNTLINCATSFVEDDEGYSVEDWFTAGAGNEVGDPGLADPYNEGAPGFVPSGAGASGGQAPSDSFFQAASFRGGVDPSNNWTSWTSFAAD